MTLTVELFFVAGSFVIGVMQVVEARALLRQGGKLGGILPYTSAIEFLWMIFAIFLLVTRSLDSAHWLAIMFLVNLAIAAVAIPLFDPDLFRREPADVRVPKPLIWLGGLVGAVYASAALAFLVH